jgi:hypothetical protein
LLECEYVLFIIFALLLSRKIINEERIRAHMLRRSGEDRRKFNDPNYKGPERRSNKERRSGMERRKNAPSDSPGQ